MPDLQLPTPKQFIANFRDRAIALTQGKLSDFSNGSALSLLAEVMAQSLEEDVQAYLDEVFPLLVARSWELLGFTQGKGAKAIASVRILLSAVNSQIFVIPKGYRFTAGKEVFETTLDAIIPANLDTANPANYAACRVGAVALNEGEAGNQPAQQCQIINPVIGLAGLFFDERADGGRSAETFEAFANRVSTALRQAVGDPEKAAIVTVTEHEDAAKLMLGDGSIAVAVPDRNLQGQNQSGAISVYCLTPAGNAPTVAQIGVLAEKLSPRAPLANGRLFYAAMPVSILNIDVGLKSLPSADPEAIAAQINQALRSAFGLQATAGMIALDINRAVQIVYSVTGVDYADPYWGWLGDPILEARRLQIPFLPGSQIKTNAVRVGTVQVVFTTGLKRIFA